MAINIVILIAAFYFLIKSGSLLVRTLLQMSLFLGVGEFALAFIVMALATSLPEFFVGVSSALSGTPVLSLGNVLGANIINITLALGFVTVISGGLALKSEIAKKDAWLIWLISIAPILLLVDLTLSRLDGVLLLAVCTLYLKRLLRERPALYAALNETTRDPASLKLFLKNFFLFTFGVVVLLASSWLIVFSADRIALDLGLPLLVVGMFLVAFGTTLPEILFGTRSALTRHEDMALGNALGSAALNSSLILGTVSIIHPIRVEDVSSFLFAAVFLIFSFLFLVVLIRTRDRLTMSHGFLLMLLYAAFAIGEALMRM